MQKLIEIVQCNARIIPKSTMETINNSKNKLTLNSNLKHNLHLQL